MTAPAADAARRAAVDVVLGVDVDAAYANLLLPRLLSERRLDLRDAAFATELCYGTLRWQGVLDEVIAAGARRDVLTLDPPVRAVLRVGAYQLLHMRVPAHAAVHATVELARAIGAGRAAGLVNAVLRRVGERQWAQWVDRLAPADELGRLAYRHGYPRWVAAVVRDALDDPDEIETALQEDRPSTHLVARPGRIGRDELLEIAGPDGAPGPWSPYAVRLAAGDPASLAPVRDGRAGVQDEGSQLAALALARAAVPAAGERWLDVCAGPGGKAALLAGLLPADGVLVAADVQTHRARLVQNSLSETGKRAVLVADGTRPAWSAAAFDRVLVDAPCTGLGALRRRPEVRWRRHPEDAERLHPLQVALLQVAVDATRSGGVVAYVTCSPHRRETRDVVDAVCATRPVLTIDARATLPGVPGVGTARDVQLWPHRHGTDAMYIALLRVDR